MHDNILIHDLRVTLAAFCKKLIDVFDRIRVLFLDIKRMIADIIHTNEIIIKNNRPKYGIVRFTNKLRSQVLNKKPFNVRIRNSC